jgi:uncharacterized protein
MSPADFLLQGQLVLLGAFLLSTALGALLHRSHFCTMGSISDVVHAGSWVRANQWILAIAFSVLGVGLLHGLNLIDIERASVVSHRLTWLSDAMGGLMFGIGMVLSSGCGAKMLVRLGSGNLKSLVVLLVMGISSFATLKGITAVLRVNTVDQFFIEANFTMTLGHWLHQGLGLAIPLWLTAVAFAVVLMAFVLWTGQARSRPTWWIGLGVGLIVCLAWLLSGNVGHVLEHPETLEDVYIKTNSNRMEALTFVAPVAYAIDWVMYFSDTNKTLTIGIMSVVGVIFGAHLSARRSGHFRWESFASVSDFKHHLVGAVLMGVGGVTAMGCTFGQGLSGMSVLSLNAMVALLFMVLGAWLAFRYQSWAMDRDAA